MSSKVIEVENLGKLYVLTHRREMFVTLRDRMASAMTGLRRRVANRFRAPTNDFARREEFWALRDVSFSIAGGERIGIVGRNGAGKSTLLKILSRITEPTTGRAIITGRVASLLEVGTGFHMDLSGRENIFLNGAILGMTRAEIRRKFDEIVAFADVEKFLDTPVKRYSSGMFVRLAFSVAAHLTPEILLVDEVLAVGDVDFQKKCMGAMQQASTEEGRTVIFVSHNLGAIQALCQRVIYLAHGRVAGIGPTGEVVDRYLREGGSSAVTDAHMVGRDFELCGLEVGGPDGAPLTTFKPVRVEVVYRPLKDVVDAGAFIIFEDLNGSAVLGMDTNDFREKVRASAGEEVRCIFDIESLPLNPGPFRLHLWLSSRADHLAWEIPRSFDINVEETLVYGTRKLEREYYGVVAARARVRIETASMRLIAQSSR
jgi:lipopolysaccharide transport system ATP-binding protein